MTQFQKLLDRIRNNPRDVRFEEACKAAQALGFTHKGGAGSHRVIARSGELMQLNSQNRGGKIAPYQARQLIAMIEKYGTEL